MTLIDLSKLDSELCNTVYLSLCSAILFSAQFAAINIQRHIAEVEGVYFGHGLVYVTFVIGLLSAPPFICALGPCWAIIISCVGFIYHLMTYSAEKMWVIFFSTVIGGMSASVLWTAQANYLVVNSTRTTLARNIGIFWSLIGVSELFGNLVLYHRLEGKVKLDSRAQNILLYAMNGLEILSLLMFLFLQNPEKQNTEEDSQQEKPGTIKVMKTTWELMYSKNMLILMVLFCYSGLEQVFVFGAYTTGVGFTHEFGNFKDCFLALSSIYISTGEILGGSVHVLLYEVINRSRSNMMIIVLLIQLLIYLAAFLNIPNNPEHAVIHLSAYIKSNVYLAILCSLLFGVTDCSLTVQIYALLGTMHPDKSAETAAIFKFIKGLSIAFFYYFSSRWHLHSHIAILVPLAIASTAAFCYVNKDFIATDRAQNATIIAEMSEIKNEDDDSSTTDGSERSLVVEL